MNLYWKRVAWWCCNTIAKLSLHKRWKRVIWQCWYMFAKMTWNIHCKNIIGQRCHMVLQFPCNFVICLTKRPCLNVKYTVFGNTAIKLPKWYWIKVVEESSGNVDICSLKWPCIYIVKTSTGNIVQWWNTFLVMLTYACQNNLAFILNLYHFATLPYGCVIFIA